MVVVLELIWTILFAKELKIGSLIALMVKEAHAHHILGMLESHVKVKIDDTYLGPYKLTTFFSPLMSSQIV